MANEKTRAQLKVLKDSKILSGGNQTTAKNLREVFDSVIDSVSNILDDADQAGGFLALDSNGLVDVTKVAAQAPVGKFLRDDGSWQTITMPIPVTEDDYTLANTGQIDLAAYTGEVILNIQDIGAQTLDKIINYSGVSKLLLRPNTALDLTINDGTVSLNLSIKLFAPTLVCFGSKYGFLEMTKRTDGTQDQFFQTNYIDQYAS
jgi:hypothetical protein